MKYKIIFTLLLITIFLIFYGFLSEDIFEVIEITPNGKINWTYKYYESNGGAYLE